MMTTQVEQLQRQLRQTYLFGFARRVFGTRKIKNEEKKEERFPKERRFLFLRDSPPNWVFTAARYIRVNCWDCDINQLI